MGSNSPRSELIYHDDTIYEDWINSRFILVYKLVLVIVKGYIGDSKLIF